MNGCGSEIVSFVSGKACEPVLLEGRLHHPCGGTGGRGALICHPHPMGGGSQDVPLVIDIAEGLCAAGVTALRFNFRGVGRSAGDFTDGLREPEDIEAGISYLESVAGIRAGEVSVIGWSFGAWVGLEALLGDEVPGRIVAIAPPLVAYDWISLAGMLGSGGEERYYLAGDRDQYCPPDMLYSFATAISHHDADKVTILPGLDHFLVGSEALIADLVRGIISG